MSKHRLATKYSDYLRRNLSKLDKDDLIEQFIETMMRVLDFDLPAVRKQVEETLLREEQEMGDEGEEEGALLQGDEETPEPDTGEESSALELYSPSSFDDLVSNLELMLASTDLDEEDVTNAIAAVESIRAYLFDTEVPRAGTVGGTLVFSWKQERGMVLVFYNGAARLERSDSSLSVNMVFTMDGDLDEKSVGKIIEAVQGSTSEN